MANNFLKNQKGQMAIEFMLLIVVILLYIQGIVQPNITLSSQALEDTTRVGQARLSAEKLVNAINSVSSSTGESKQTINLFIPEDAWIECNSGNPGTVNFWVLIQGEVATNCVFDDISGKYKCSPSKPLEVIEGTNLCCTPPPCGDKTYGSDLTSLFKELLVYKDSAGVVRVE